MEDSDFESRLGLRAEQWLPYFLKSVMKEKPENLVKNRDALVSTLDDLGYTEAASIIQNLEIPEQGGKVDLTGLGIQKERGEMGSMAEVDAALRQSIEDSLEKMGLGTGRKKSGAFGLPSLARKKKTNLTDVLGLNL